MRPVFFRNLLAGILISSTAGIFCAGVDPDAVFQANKESGDRAFAARSFDTAAAFYRAYRQDAELRNDSAALQDAFECEINSLILGAKAAQAEDALASYRLKFPEADPLSLSLWTADILLLKHRAQDAAEILEKILPELPKQDSRRIRAMMALAAAAELRKDYKTAAELYSALLENSSDTPFMRAIGERRILALTAQGNTGEAVELLAKLKLNEDERSIEAYRLLNIYLSLKNRAEVDSFTEEKMMEDLKTDSFFYLITSLIGDEFAAQKNYDSALAAYRLAYLYARTSPDAFNALNRMIMLFEGMGKKEEAAALAATQIDLFLRPGSSMQIKMAVIRLFATAKRDAEAIRLAEACLNTPGQDQETTFRTLFRLMTGNRVLDTAEKLIDLYKGKDEAFKLACKAEVQLLRGNKKAAADLYREAAGKGNFAVNARIAAELYSALKEYETVIDLTGKLLAQTNDAKLLFHRAAAYEALKQYSRARQDYLTCEKKTDDPVLAMQAAFRAAVLYYHDKDFNTASKIFERIFLSDDKLAPSAGFWFILCANQNDSLTEKRTFALAKRFPASRYAGLALLKLADHYIGYGLQEKADKLLSGVTGENTELPKTIQAQALYRRALLEYRNQEYEKAMAFLQTVLSGEDAEKIDNLADIYYLSGDILRAGNRFEEAAEAYRTAAKLRPDSRLAQAAAGSEGDCCFAIASKGDKAEGYRTALTIYSALLEQPNLLPEYFIMTSYKAGRCHQLLGEAEKAAELYREMIFSRSLKELSARPVERYWIQKGINEFELIAIKSADAGLINEAINAMTVLLPLAPDQEDYKKRIKKLKSLKRNITITGDDQK